MKKKFAEIINVIFGFRKMLLMILVIAIAVFFRIWDLINGAEMVDLIKNVGIAFMGANGIEHIVGCMNTYMNNKSQPAPLADTNEANDEEEVEDVK